MRTGLLAPFGVVACYGEMIACDTCGLRDSDHSTSLGLVAGRGDGSPGVDTAWLLTGRCVAA